MLKLSFAGLVALALLVNTADAGAAAKKKATARRKAAVSRKAVKKPSMEELAWGDTPAKAKTTAKKPAVKTVKKDDGLKPTVKVNTNKIVTPVATTKPEPKKTDEPEKTTEPNSTVAAADSESKAALDLEKKAQEQAKKDPRGALGTYEKLVEANPNYAYAGDVYADMYRLSERSNADLLTRIKYAGMAGQKLEAGLSRKPVSPKDLQKYKQAEETLINKWIEVEIQKIYAEQR